MVKCSSCGKERTDEPDYNPMALLVGDTANIGWYNGPDGSFCPEDMEKLYKMANQLD